MSDSVKSTKSLQELRDIATKWQEVNPSPDEALQILHDVVANVDQSIQELKAIKYVAESRIEEIIAANQLSIF